MTSSRRATIAVMAVVLGMLIAAKPAMAQDRPIKIAIANAAKIFSEVQETKDLRVKMENDRKSLQAQDQGKQEELKSLQSARNLLKPDAPQYQEKNKELLQKAIEYKAWAEMQQANMQHEQKVQMKAIFDKIQVAVADIAKQKGIDLVLAEQKPEFPDDIDAINVDQLRMLINQRNILFVSGDRDISNDVIASLDAKYKEAK